MLYDWAKDKAGIDRMYGVTHSFNMTSLCRLSSLILTEQPWIGQGLGQGCDPIGAPQVALLQVQVGATDHEALLAAAIQRAKDVGRNLGGLPSLLIAVLVADEMGKL